MTEPGFNRSFAATIVGAQKLHARKDSDFYPTPPDVTHALLNFLTLPPGTSIWEPAAGDGAMSRVMERRGFQVLSSDIRDEPGVVGQRGVDFLSGDLLHQPDWIITNPPFNVAADFIRKALSITPNVAMLLKSQFWHARSRSSLFHANPPSVILALTWRPAFLESERGRSPLMDVIWCVWSGARTGATRYEPLPRPSASEMPTDVEDIFG